MRKKTFKLLSVMLVAMLLLSLVQIPAFAATRIGAVSVLDVDQPQEGAFADYGVYIPDTTYDLAELNTNGYKNGIKWEDEFGNTLEPDVDKFKAGVKYTVNIVLTPVDYNVFAVFSAKINGEEVAFSGSSFITLKKEYEAVEDDETLHMITADYGFDDNYYYIFCKDGQPAPYYPDEIENGELLFYGWYADKEFTFEYDFDTPVYGDKTIYARYVDAQDIVSIYTYVEDFEFPYSVCEGVKGDHVYIEDIEPEDEQLCFYGWYFDKEFKEPYTNESIITEDTHLYACIIPYSELHSVNIYVFSDAEPLVGIYVKDGDCCYFSDPGQEGKIFDGWYTEPQRINKFDFSTPITQDINLYAKFDDIAVLGDVDGDGVLTVLDATAIQRYVANLAQESFNELVADFDQDGNITILDATIIQKALVQE